MLVEFRVSNFRSFKDDQPFSMVASRNDNSHPDNTIASDNLALLKTAAVYGPNASGKSNFVSAFRLMRDTVVGSARDFRSGKGVPGMDPFRLSASCIDSPSVFEVTFIHEDVRYEFGFSATAERICDEWLYSYPLKRKRIEIEREFDLSSGKTRWDSNRLRDADLKMLKDRTRENCLVMSRAAELDMEPYASIFRWFEVRTIPLDISHAPDRLWQLTLAFARSQPSVQDNMFMLVKEADLGISGMNIRESDGGDLDKATILRKKLEQALRPLADEDGITIKLPDIDEHPVVLDIIHQSSELPDGVTFDLDKESSGTKRILALSGPLFDALDSGKLLLVDELGCSLHPSLTRKIVELFNSELNNKGAQLVFATHDYLTMDPSLLRRDQIWLMEKDAQGATDLYSLSDIEGVRAAEPFLRKYRAGRYGAVPDFGAWLEDRTKS